MGDRAWAKIEIFSWPDRAIDLDGDTVTVKDRIVGLLDDYSFADDASIRDAGITLEPGAEFEVDEVSLGVLDELGPDLDELGVEYAGWQEAKYEFDGDVRMRFNDLGVFSSVTNSDGQAYLRYEDVVQHIRVLVGDADNVPVPALLARIGQQTGKPWYDRIDEIRRRVATP